VGTFDVSLSPGGARGDQPRYELEAIEWKCGEQRPVQKDLLVVFVAVLFSRDKTSPGAVRADIVRCGFETVVLIRR
jgi:hypothetical protein